MRARTVATRGLRPFTTPEALEKARQTGQLLRHNMWLSEAAKHAHDLPASIRLQPSLVVNAAKDAQADAIAKRADRALQSVSQAGGVLEGKVGAPNAKRRKVAANEQQDSSESLTSATPTAMAQNDAFTTAATANALLLDDHDQRVMTALSAALTSGTGGAGIPDAFVLAKAAAYTYSSSDEAAKLAHSSAAVVPSVPTASGGRVAVAKGGVNSLPSLVGGPSVGLPQSQSVAARALATAGAAGASESSVSSSSSAAAPAAAAAAATTSKVPIYSSPMDLQFDKINNAATLRDMFLSLASRLQEVDPGALTSALTALPVPIHAAGGGGTMMHGGSASSVPAAPPAPTVVGRGGRTAALSNLRGGAVPVAVPLAVAAAMSPAHPPASAASAPSSAPASSLASLSAPPVAAPAAAAPVPAPPAAAPPAPAPLPVEAPPPAAAGAESSSQGSGVAGGAGSNSNAMDEQR